MNAAIEEQPLVETAKATELARRRTRVDAVGAQMLKEGGDILLGGIQEHAMSGLKELSEGPQIAQVGLASEWTQSLLDAQVGLVILEKRQVGGWIHRLIMGALQRGEPARFKLPYLVHQGINFSNMYKIITLINDRGELFESSAPSGRGGFHL
jgi:hypothetical protein